MNFVDDTIILPWQKGEHAGDILCSIVLMQLDGRSIAVQYKILLVCEGKHDKRH